MNTSQKVFRIIGVVGSRAKSKDINTLIGKVVHQHLDTTDTQTVYLSGGASSGADYWIKKYCSDYKLQYIEAPAFWSKLYRYTNSSVDFDKSAGIRRNRTIALVCTELWSFWDGESKGTKYTMDRVTELGKPVKVIDISHIHPVDQIEKAVPRWKQ